MKSTSVARITIQNYWQHTKSYKFLFWISVIGASMGVVFQDIIPPLIIARTFGKLQADYANHATLTFSTYLPYFYIFSLFLLLAVVVWRIQGYCTWVFETRVRRDLAIYVYNNLQAQSQRFHSDRFGGALVSQTSKYLNAYEKLMDEFIWSVVTGVTALTVSLGVLVFVSYQYALVLFTIIIIYMLIMSKRMVIQFPFNRKSAERDSEQTAALADAITNMGTIRAFANEDYETKRFTSVVNRTKRSYHKLTIEVLKSDSISHIQTNSFHIVALLCGLVAITNFNASIGVLYLVLAYTQGIVNRLWQFGRIMRNINQALGDANAMTTILEIKPEITDTPTPTKSKIQRGSIELNNITFYYPENPDQPLFENLNLRIKPGEKVGLVGQSGGGKTTLTKLLLRFMDIQNGNILIDNQDITHITQHSLRQRIAYVPQEPMLFHRSILENIQYGNQDAQENEVLAVSKLANAHEFIEKLPQGYKTLVGERGVKLSGGQRQRVAIARAMLKNAPILVLDEATSALDSESEVLIQDALWKLMENRTAIVIAHRLSTVQKMDRIVVLKDGKIAEQGTHKELIRKNEVYGELWKHQSGGFIDD